MDRGLKAFAMLLNLAGCAPSGSWSPPSNAMGAAEPAPPPATARPPRRLAGVEVRGCPQGFVERFNPGPTSPGPLRLVSLSCLDFERSPFGVSDPILSPDGTAAARWHQGQPAPIEIVGRERPERVAIPNRVSFREFGSSVGGNGLADALAWASDSRRLWAVRQSTMAPSGFALGGLEPVVIGRDGAVHALPALRHRAGPLDAILWVGGDGLALTQFGARGRYYRPEHDDPAPVLAMVDAARGRVLATVPKPRTPPQGASIQMNGPALQRAAGTVLRDGRMRAVIAFGPWAEGPRSARPDQRIVHPPVWMVWTQGEPPLTRPAFHPEEIGHRFALTRDGSRLLVIRPLQPGGTPPICPRAPPCRPGRPIPRTGPIAELIDIGTWRVLWRLPARVERFWAQGAEPAISPDGRFALIALPPAGDRLPIALVDLERGRIVQTIAPAQVGSYRYGLGFTADGRQARVSVDNLMHLYRIGRL